MTSKEHSDAAIRMLQETEEIRQKVRDDGATFTITPIELSTAQTHALLAVAAAQREFNEMCQLSEIKICTNYPQSNDG